MGNVRRLMSAMLVMALPLFACAPEQSAEKRRREQEQREIERLGRGEGTFAGDVTLANGARIPLALDLAVARNADAATGENKPQLTAKARLGLLGGVELVSQAVAFDAGSGILTATFTGAGAASEQLTGGGGRSIEMQAHVADSGLDNVRLVSQGGRTYAATAARVATSGLALATEASFDYAIDIAMRDRPQEATVAVLTLKRQTGLVGAPASSDLPNLPALDATLRFPGAGVVAHRATLVNYDALFDTLEIQFPANDQSPGGVRLLFTDVSLNDGLQLTFNSKPRLVGSVTIDGSVAGDVSSGSDAALSEATKPEASLPPPSYVGTFLAAADGLTFAAIGEMQYLGNQVAGSTSDALGVLPNLSLKITLCHAGEAYEVKSFKLSSLAYLGQEGLFSQEGGTDYRLPFSFGDAWRTFDGNVLTAGESSDASTMKAGEPQLKLKASEKAVTSCKDLRDRAAPVARRFGNREIGADDLTYEGYMTRGANGVVPIGVQIFPRRNPNGGSDEPSLQVTARIGFFGGASIASEPAVFNWGNGRLTASFTRPSGAPLEFATTLKQDVLDDATLVGPNLGQHAIWVSHAEAPFSDITGESTLNVLVKRDAGDAGLRSVLTLRSRSEGTPAPANIDLPLLPSLEASLKIDGLGQTPQLSRRIVYDVLRGTIEVYFSESSILEFRDVFLMRGPAGGRRYLPFTELGGRLSLGGQPLADAQAFRVVKPADRWTIQDVPFPVYSGSLVTAGGSMTYRAVGTITYQGNAGANTAEYPFGTFPNLNFTILLCMRSSEIQHYDMKLDAVDHLARSLLFKNRIATLRDELDAVFEPGWVSISGTVRDTGGSSGSPGGSQLSMRAVPGLTQINCATTLPFTEGDH